MIKLLLTKKIIEICGLIFSHSNFLCISDYFTMLLDANRMWIMNCFVAWVSISLLFYRLSIKGHPKQLFLEASSFANLPLALKGIKISSSLLFSNRCLTTDKSGVLDKITTQNFILLFQHILNIKNNFLCKHRQTNNDTKGIGSCYQIACP